MNATVAVALITSLSTLTAAAVTGLVSVRVTGRQLRHQEQLAREQRAEQRANSRRETRRECCERFLAEVDSAYRTLDAGWNSPRASRPEGWESGFAARRALDEAYIRLSLAGSEDLAARAKEVLRSVAEEFRLLKEATEATEASVRAEALRERTRSTDAFVRAARGTLDPARREP